MLIEIEKMLRQQNKHKISYKTICNELIHPSISKIDIPFKFEIPKIEPFKGKENLKEHLRCFKYSIYLISKNDALMLRIFPMTFVGQAMDWYNNLIEHSITTYAQLANLFLEYFRINIKDKTSMTYLIRL